MATAGLAAFARHRGQDVGFGPAPCRVAIGDDG